MFNYSIDQDRFFIAGVTDNGSLRFIVPFEGIGDPMLMGDIDAPEFVQIDVSRDDVTTWRRFADFVTAEPEASFVQGFDYRCDFLDIDEGHDDFPDDFDENRPDPRFLVESEFRQDMSQFVISDNLLLFKGCVKHCEHAGWEALLPDITRLEALFEAVETAPHHNVA